MSLRSRLSGLICVVLLLSVAFDVMIVYVDASRSVRTEIHAALIVCRQTIENAIERLQDAHDPARALDDLVASFKGNRHLRVRLIGAAPADASPAAEGS